MDIWHRVGRIVRFSNLGTLLFFTLNILLIVAVFGSSGSIVELICIYFFTVAISLSPLGEMCLAAFAGASDIKRVDLADEFAYKIGFGLELATVLDQHISDVPHDGFLSAIYSTHPCNDDRVAALQNLGVPYSRY